MMKLSNAEDINITDSTEKKIETKENFFSMWKEMLWDVYLYRELLLEMFKRDIRVKYKQAVLGYFWTLFMPSMVVFSGFVIKYVMATISGSGFTLDSFAIMSVKAVAWSFFIGSTVAAANSLVGNIGLITKIYFPREVFPMSCFISNSFDFAIGSATLLTILICIQKFSWSIHLLWVPVLFVLMVMLGLAIGMFFSCEMVFYRDVRYILGLLTSYGIFYTPIFFEPNQLGSYGFLVMLNPISPILEGFRLVIVDGHNLLTPMTDTAGVAIWQPWYLAYAAAFAILSLFFSWMHFHKSEFLYAEYI